MWLLVIMAVAAYVGDAKYLLVDIQEDTEGEVQGIGKGKYFNDVEQFCSDFSKI